MKELDFNEFLDSWREDSYINDVPNRAFMEEYFAEQEEEIIFSDKQFQKIIAFIVGQKTEEVILVLGNTELSKTNKPYISQAANFVSEIKVTYQYTAEIANDFHKAFPKITLKSIVSNDKNYFLEVDDEKFVFNSSEMIKHLDRAEGEFNINSLRKALICAYDQLIRLSEENKTLAQKMKKFEHKAKITSTEKQEILALFKSISGTNVDESIPIDFLTKRLKLGAQYDIKKYRDWANRFQILANLAKDFNPSQYTSIQLAIDKMILLFADFISLTQTETRKDPSQREQSINDLELHCLREILRSLITKAASPNYRLVTEVVNFTEFNLLGMNTHHVGCALTPSPRIRKIIPLISRLLITEIASKSKEQLEAHLHALKQCNNFLQSYYAFYQHPGNVLTTEFTEYNNLCTLFGPVYTKCLLMAESLQAVGITQHYCSSEKEVAYLTQLITNKFQPSDNNELFKQIIVLSKDCYHNLVRNLMKIKEELDIKDVLNSSTVSFMKEAKASAFKLGIFDKFIYSPTDKSSSQSFNKCL